MPKLKISLLVNPNKHMWLCLQICVCVLVQKASVSVDVQSVGQDLCRLQIWWWQAWCCKTAELKCSAALAVPQWPTVRVAVILRLTVMQYWHYYMQYFIIIYYSLLLFIIKRCTFSRSVIIYSWYYQHSFSEKLKYWTSHVCAQADDHVLQPLCRVTWSVSPIWLNSAGSKCLLFIVIYIERCIIFLCFKCIN